MLVTCSIAIEKYAFLIVVFLFLKFPASLFIQKSIQKCWHLDPAALDGESGPMPIRPPVWYFEMVHLQRLQLSWRHFVQVLQCSFLEDTYFTFILFPWLLLCTIPPLPCQILPNHSVASQSEQWCLMLN